MKQLSVFFISLLVGALYAISVSDIEEVRLRTESSRSELSTADRDFIENFWDDALNRMLLAEDTQGIVEIRRQLESQTGTQPLSFYSAAYVASAKQNLQTAFDNVERMEDANKRQLLEQNLMILTAALRSPALVQIALDRINHEDTVVRYWAVKAVTNSGVIQGLSSDVTADEETKVKILNTLKQRLEIEPQIEIKRMIIHFTAAMDYPVAREILLAMADKRIDAYNKWSVDQETLDIQLLIGMGHIAMAATDAQTQSTFGRKFAELYALAFQRYLAGQGILSEKQMGQVLNVILEVDTAVLAKMLNVPQTGIAKAIQRKVGLEREYEIVFGNRLSSGDLGTLYKFDYGKDASGNAVTEPPKLPAPPAN